MTAPGASAAEHHAALALDGSSQCVLTARSFARAHLEQCAPDLAAATVHDALMLVSEMVTNAVRHAPGPCALYLVNDDKELTIAVSDTSTEVPRPRTPDPHGGGGFGWHLLRSIATQVDVHLRPPHGKTVCATMRTLTSSPHADRQE